MTSSNSSNNNPNSPSTLGGTSTPPAQPTLTGFPQPTQPPASFTPSPSMMARAFPPQAPPITSPQPPLRLATPVPSAPPPSQRVIDAQAVISARADAQLQVVNARAQAQQDRIAATAAAQADAHQQRMTEQAARDSRAQFNAQQARDRQLTAIDAKQDLADRADARQQARLDAQKAAQDRRLDAQQRTQDKQDARLETRKQMQADRIQAREDAHNRRMEAQSAAKAAQFRQTLQNQIAGGGLTSIAQSLAARNPITAILAGIIGFSGRMAQANTIKQALGNITGGEILSGAFSKLQEVGGKGVQFELPAMQAGATRGMPVFSGAPTDSPVYESIVELSTAVGLPMNQAAALLRDVGAGTRAELSVRDIAGLLASGFAPTGISALGSKTLATGAGGIPEIFQAMGIAQRRGLSNTGITAFAGAAAGFATNRRMAGLGGDMGRAARRAASMDTDLEPAIGTLTRFQSVGLNAAKGLSGFAQGMTDIMLQSYAFEKEGGDIFKAVRRLEDMSESPESMRSAMREMGASRAQIDVALLASGLTTRDVDRGRRSRLAEAAPIDLNVPAADATTLTTSRAVATKGQRDLKELYSTAEGESVASRFAELMRQQSNYQSKVLSKMPTSTQIENIVDKLIRIVEATDFMRVMMNRMGTIGSGPPEKNPDTASGRARLRQDAVTGAKANL